MCGIAGIAGPAPIDQATLTRMGDVMAHRGPDDSGMHIGDGIGMTFRRLAIIDLTPTGHQPMPNEDGSAMIVFNGEIYNHADIRPELEARGHVFRGRSDTEVVLHAYEEWGPSCVERFNGMWGFAIWDSRTRTLFASRDRFGVKPFYYRFDGTELIFGSEIKCILAAGVEARVDQRYAAHVIVKGMFDDGDETFFEGIRQLPPGHSLTFDGGHLTVFAHWRLDPEAARERYSFASPSEGVLELLADAVRLRVMSSDVRVGSCLSGGIDSSSIVALARGLYDSPMATFSVVYPGADYDEREYSDLVARTFDVERHMEEPDGSDFFDVLAKMVWHQDEPSVAPGLYSQWHVMKLAHPEVKVLLDGQGGDELFAGYHHHLEAHLRGLPGSAGWSATLKAAPAVAATLGRSVPLQLASTFGPRWARAAYGRILGTGTADDVGPELRDIARRDPIVRRSPLVYEDDPLNDRLYYDLTRDVIPSLLHYEDRNSMAFSIEARTPFLDYRLVEYAFSLAGDTKLEGGQLKGLLRRAMRGVTPDPVLDRSDKKGYSTPVREWFRGHLVDGVRDMLLSQSARERGIFDAETVARKLDDHVSGRLDLSWQISRWLTVEQWFRTFVDRRDPALGPVTRR
jgi:asparagine synthase (glutamine-hydrolysing)